MKLRFGNSTLPPMKKTEEGGAVPEEEEEEELRSGTDALM